ncbi:MAG: condensation domain-containing protein [Candidatus Thorarchaeota archaeon]
MTISHDNKPYRREVTRQERRFLFSPTSDIALALRIQGQISEKALRKAVDKVLVTYPLFGVRLEWIEDDVHWSTTEGAAEVPIKTYPRDSDESWIDALNKEHAIPLRPSKGPLTRFILIQGPDVSELMIYCHHAISDGRSLEFALREVLLHLKDANREPPKFPEMPPMTPAIFPKGAAVGKVRGAAIGRYNSKWLREKVSFDEEDLVNIWEATWKNTEYGLEIIEFDEKETQKLIEVSRENKVTLNSAILVTFVKARFDAVGRFEDKIRVATTVDARTRLQVDCSGGVGFYAGGSFLNFNYREKSSIWDNIRSYHKDVRKQLESSKIFGVGADHFVLDQTLVDAIVVAIVGDQVEPHQSRYTKLSEFASKTDGMAAKFGKSMSGNSPEIMCTNLGKLDLPDDLPGIQIDRALFAPSSAMGMEVVLGVATTGGKLTITLNYYEGYVDGENIRKVRDRAEEILRGLIE